MRRLVRWWAIALAVVCAGSGIGVGIAQAGRGASSGVPGGFGDVSFALDGSPLVEPADASLLGEEQESAQTYSLRMNPFAVQAREASRSEFRGLSSSAVQRLALKSFPLIVGTPAGTLRLPAGERVTRYLNTNAARVSLSGGRQAIVESFAPIAVRSGARSYSPINLALHESGGGYAPIASGVNVQIPRRLSAGVGLGSTGVSVTQSDARGVPLSATGSPVDRASVVYANTLTDADTLVKPTVPGFQIDTLLRSAQSPTDLHFAVSLPRGARLVQAHGTGAITVEQGDSTLATILPPTAVDAAGTPVPATTRIAGKRIDVDVAHRGGSYQYPIDVDPEVNDKQLATTSGGKRSNWEFKSSNEASFGHKAVYESAGVERLETYAIAGYEATALAYWGYETKGDSKIFELKAETEAHNKGSKIESFLSFEKKPSGEIESKELLSTELENSEYTRRAASPLCGRNSSGKEECLPASGSEKNAVLFQQSATAGGSSFSDTLYQGIVSISEPTGAHATTGFNTTSPEVEGEVEVEGKKIKQRRTNVLYGSGSWLSKYQGAVEWIAKDAGIGVSATRLEYESSTGKWEQLVEHGYLEKENACEGVQCYPSHSEYWTVDPKLPDGEDKVRYRAEDAMEGTKSLESEGVTTLKVDTTPPRELSLGGLPWGNELSERPYTLTGEAIDGEGSVVAASGVKSIKLFVQGREIAEVGKQTGCVVAKGECKAKAEWTINGAELGAGHHAIVMVATDNAGNEARIQETISVRHSTPVALGPGSVDLQSGDFSLGATDVSMGSGLTVARNYSSRDLTAGVEGPLGPQWSMSLSSTASLVEMVDGGVLMTSANGSQTIFAATTEHTSSGELKFESPPGDSNLALTLEENKEKEKLAYYLANAANHTKVKFTLPSFDATAWVPTRQEGTVATDTVAYAYRTVEQNPEYVSPTGSFPRAEYSLPSKGAPVGIAMGSEGNMWTTIYNKSTIAKITPHGAVTEYSFPQESGPEDVAAGRDGDLWVTLGASSKIAKVTPTGAITEYALPEKSEPVGITVGPDGNLWFTEQGKHSVVKITTSGVITEYKMGGFVEPKPIWIASGPDGNLWVTVEGIGVWKIDKISTSGSILAEYELPKLNVPHGIASGPDESLWVTLGDGYSENKLDRVTTSGSITGYALPENSGPTGVVAGPDGNLWVTLKKRDAVAKVTPSGKIVTEYSLPTGSGPEGIATGPNKTLWFADYGTSKAGLIVPPSITEPIEALAPVPPKVKCGSTLETMEPGCRALRFKYGTKTTAHEPESEWGEYENRLMQVLLAAYNPASKKMEEVPVAEYSYDGKGRLRAAWNPRISPALKTIYGYDQEGHVTALTPPGQESWAFTYGTIAGDAGTGRLIKATQAPASAGLWNGEKPADAFRPTISGSPEVGVRLAVSNGVWSASPVAYAYQWEDCNTAGGECKPIAGASNANYTPVNSDAGHTLVAQVTATNGGGSAVASTVATATVVAKFYTQSIDAANSVNAVSCLPSTTECVASDSKGNAFYATNVSASAAAAWTAWNGPGTSPSEAVDCPASSLCLLAAGSNSGYGGNLYYATSIGGAWTQAYSPTYGVDAISCVSSTFCVDGQDNGGYFRYSTNPPSTSWTLESQGAAAMKGVFCLSTSFCAIADGAGSVHIATSTTQIESSSWTATDVDGTSALNGVVCTSTSSCIAVDGAGNVLNLAVATNGTATASKHDIDGANSLTAVTCSGSTCAIVDNHGNVFTSTNSGETWTNQYQLGNKLTAVSCASTSLCATVDAAGNVTGFNPAPGTPHEGEARPAQPGSTLEYGVSLAGGLGLETMTSGEVAKWGQKDVPVEATAILPPDSPQGWPASSYTRATVYYMDGEGRATNVSTPSTATYGSITTREYNEYNDVVRTLTPDNRQVALEAGSKSVEVAKLLSTESTYNGEGAKETEVSEPGTRLIETLGPQHTVKYVAGKELKESLARNHAKYFYDEGAPANGETYNLVTKESDLAQLANEEEVEVRKTTKSYSGQSNLGWRLRAPTAVVEDPEGKKITHTTLYNAETAQIEETRGPAGQAGESAHDEKTVYYSSEANATYPSCGGHPEWSGLVCETLPAKQLETPGLPKLPMTSTTYNVWNEPEVVTETFGTIVRKKVSTYDAAGRLIGSEVIAEGSGDQAVPKVNDEYNSQTGVLEKQSTTVEGKTKTITSVYNTLGQLTSYTDAGGNTAKYVYGGPENDNLLEEMTDGSNGGASRQTYAYNATTKTLEKLWDSAAETFTAIYDAEGRLVSEVYPNGMCANTGYNSVGEATNVEYIKTTVCSEKNAPVWFSESKVSSIHGETLTRGSSLASETYSYDSLGRLLEAQETPAGGGCSIRVYAYDEESNRTSLTKRAPGTKGECLTEGGTVEEHKYDEANRMTDSGIEYDSVGNITKLPAADAEGHELTSTFYVDNAVSTQTQNGVTNAYLLDPNGRIEETTTGSAKMITHYDTSGETVAWTGESAEKWTRNIPGIDGTLSAVQANGETPVLQLHDLKGNIVATASLNKEATQLLSTYNSTEFGVPSEGKTPPTFAWLGATDVSRSLSSGVITYGATSYVPQTGRPLEAEEVEPPGAPEGTGAGAPFVSQQEPWVMQGAAHEAAEAPGLEAGREMEAAEEAVNKALASGGADPEAIFSPEYTEDFAAHWDQVAKENLNAIEPWEEKFGRSGVIDTINNNVEFEEAFARELRHCAKAVRKYKYYAGFGHHEGMCWAGWLDKNETFISFGTLDLLLGHKTKYCTWIRGYGLTNEVYKCAGTPHYYYKNNRAPQATGR